MLNIKGPSDSGKAETQSPPIRDSLPEDEVPQPGGETESDRGQACEEKGKESKGQG